MVTRKKTFYYSPSLNHRSLMDQMKPALAYDGGDVRAWQRRLRRKLRALVGDMPRKRGPLKVRSLWKKEHPLGTIEKLVFTSEPYADVPGYLCLPRSGLGRQGGGPPYPTMICVQGHTTGMHNSIAVDQKTEKKTIKVAGDRDFALGCMARGVAAFAIELRSFGERLERVQEHVASHGCHDATMHALMLGRTIIGERIYDVDRAIDYLRTRDDVDMKRLGVMGNSGGGMVSVFSAALLPRIRCAMPSCYFCTFRDSVMSIYHCMDNYVPGLLKYAEMADVMGLFAPRPVVIVAGRDDPIFPIRATRRAFKRLKAIYRAAGAEDRCHLVVGEGGHRFYAAKAWPKMLKELKAHNQQVATGDYPKLRPHSRLC